MSQDDWFKEEPSRHLKTEIQLAAERELDRRLGESPSENRRFIDFSRYGLLALPLAAAGFAAFWLKQKEQAASSGLNDDIAAIHGLDFLSLEADDFDLLTAVDSGFGSALDTDSDFFDDLDILEDITDEEMS